MKITLKPNKTEKIILIIFFALIMVFLITDIIMLELGKTPVFCIRAGRYLDGGTTVYIGMGYKIIDYNVLDGYDGYKVGTLFMRYDSSI